MKEAKRAQRTGSGSPVAAALSWSMHPSYAPQLSDNGELGVCLEILAALAVQRPEEGTHFQELLKIIDNIWQEPAQDSINHAFIRSEATAQRAYVRRKIYSLLLQKETLAYSADPFAGWIMPYYSESEAALSLEKKTLQHVRGKAIKALLERLIAFPEGREKDHLFSALGDYASMLWRAYLNTTDYRAPRDINWPLLRAAYEAEMTERNTSVFAIGTD